DLKTDRRAVEGDGQHAAERDVLDREDADADARQGQAVAGGDACGLEIDARSAERGEEGLELVDERERAGKGHLVDVHVDVGLGAGLGREVDLGEVDRYEKSTLAEQVEVEVDELAVDVVSRLRR